MKNIYLILALLIITLMIILGSNNDILMNLSLKCINCSIKTNFQIVSALVFAMGIITGVLIMLRFITDETDKNSAYRKQLEKTSVGMDENKLKIKTLENKIQTLELALKKALENKED